MHSPAAPTSDHGPTKESGATGPAAPSFQEGGLRECGFAGPAKQTQKAGECGAVGSTASFEEDAAQRAAPHSTQTPHSPPAPIILQPLDKTQAIEKTRQFLPHWTQSGCTYFVTYRLADSFPQSVLREWQAEMDVWLKFNPKPWDDIAQREYNKRFEGPRQKWLDAGHGSCVLRDPTLRAIVVEGFHHFDGQRYDLGDYVIMPNHVHVIVTPGAGWELSRILHTWKSYSGHEILKRTRGEPPFWLQESFDHAVRSERQLNHYRNYIRENPEKAKLWPGKFTHWERPACADKDCGSAGSAELQKESAAQRAAPHSFSAPVLIALLSLLALIAPLHADSIGESADFTIDTRDYGGSPVAESGDFTVNTTTNSGSGPVEGGLFTVDTRAPDAGRGVGEAGDFTINTRGTGAPLPVEGFAFAAASTGAGAMRWTLTVPPKRAGAVPVFQFSFDGGATWLLVMGVSPPGALLAGANTRTWNYRAALPANTLAPNPLLRVTLNGITGDYALPPVDTRAVFAASGRVLNAATGLALAGVSVTSAAASATTDAQGRFVLSNPGATLMAARAGYETTTAPTLATGRTDARQLVVPDVRLSAASATAPVVVEFKKDHAGLVMPFNAAARACALELSGVVDWKGHAPGTVRLSHSGGWSFPATVTAAGGGKSVFTAELDENSYLLWNNLTARAPEVLAQAIAGDGALSNFIPLTLKTARVPTWMKTSLELGVATVEADCRKFSVDLTFPADAQKLNRGFGLLGTFVYEPQFTAGFELDYGTGEWEFSLGGEQERGFRPHIRQGPRIKWDRATITSSVSGSIVGRVKETPGGWPFLVTGGGLRTAITRKRLRTMTTSSSAPGTAPHGARSRD